MMYRIFYASYNISCTLLIFLTLYSYLEGDRTISAENIATNSHRKLKWIVNYPVSFESGYHSFGKLTDIRGNKENESIFLNYVEDLLPHIQDPFDGENLDVIEHFFWGMRGGLALELGALDGSPDTRSVTYDLERHFDWKRILIEGNPMYREGLRSRSPNAFGVIAPICESHVPVHYAVTKEYHSGILEFMPESLIKLHHNHIYGSNAEMILVSHNLSSIDWSKVDHVHTVECMPLRHVVHKAKATHINFFVLHAQGGELNVLKSVNWNHTSFDIIVVETDPVHRPVGYGDMITSYLDDRGYINATAQLGKNIWYRRKDFQSTQKPGLSSTCFNGYRHAEHTLQTRINHGGPGFHPCPVQI